MSDEPSDIADDNKLEIIAKGRYLHFLRRGTWEYVHRPGVTGIVVIVAITDDENIVLTEQFRIPLGRNVIELPAGLAGDCSGHEGETVFQAAERELLEETGYLAGKITKLTEGPPSPGASDEVITFLLANRLKKVHAGGGDHSEDITVHEIPLEKAHDWLAEQEKDKRLMVDPKIYTGLYFLQRRRR